MQAPRQAPGRLSAAASHALRTSFACCFASSLTLVPPLRDSFSVEVKPLLPSAAVMAIFCTGSSFEEVMWFSVESFAGSVGAVLNAGLVRALLGFEHVEIHSWLSLAVLLEGSLVTALICLLPFSENIKIYMISLAGYFLLDLFESTQLSLLQMSLEYIMVASFGSVCVVVAFCPSFQSLVNECVLHRALDAIEDVADDCAEVIRETSAAFLGNGAGEAWYIVTSNRLRVLSRQLGDARSDLEFQFCSLSSFLGLWIRGHRETLQQQKVAFETARDAIHTCQLLCELAARVHTRGSGVGLPPLEFAALRSSGKLTEQLQLLAEGTADLLKDVARTCLQQLSVDDLLTAQSYDEKRIKFERTLQCSSEAAEELFLLGRQDSFECDISRSEFVSAQSDMAAFLFLVYALAVDIQMCSDDGLACHTSGHPKTTKNDDRLPYDVNSIRTPLILPHKPRRNRILDVSMFSSLWSWIAANRRSNDAMGTGMLRALISKVRSVLHQRCRFSLKVTLSFAAAFAACLYAFDLDSTMIFTVVGLCSYGSQFAGGSLQRSMSRSLGVAIGSTIGSTFQQIAFAVSDQMGKWYWSSACISLFTALLLLIWVFLTMWHSFTGGPYAYCSFCAAFTAIKFFINTGKIDVSSMIKHTMFAVLLTVMVEMCILPVSASGVLRSRLAAVLEGSSVALAKLIVSGEEKAIGEHTISSSLEPPAPQPLSRATSVKSAFDPGDEENGKSVANIILEAATVAKPYVPTITSGMELEEGNLHMRAVNDALPGDNIFLTEDPAFAKGMAEASRGEFSTPQAHFAVHLDAETAMELPRLATLLSQLEPQDLVVDEKDEELPPLFDDISCNGERLTSDTKPLSEINALLDEITSFLDSTPSIAELIAEAAVEFDAKRDDGQAWQSLATSLGVMRLRLSVLARITQKIGHGVSVQELLGGSGEEAKILVETFGKTLREASKAVNGDVAPAPRVCRELETQLRDSTTALAFALSDQRAAGPTPRPAEVLSGTARNTLVSLLGDAAKVFALSVAVTAPASQIWKPQVEALERANFLPDLTEHLKRAGHYQTYLRLQHGPSALHANEAHLSDLTIRYPRADMQPPSAASIDFGNRCG